MSESSKHKKDKETNGAIPNSCDILTHIHKLDHHSKVQTSVCTCTHNETHVCLKQKHPDAVWLTHVCPHLHTVRHSVGWCLFVNEERAVKSWSFSHRAAPTSLLKVCNNIVPRFSALVSGLLWSYCGKDKKNHLSNILYFITKEAAVQSKHTRGVTFLKLYISE